MHSNAASFLSLVALATVIGLGNARLPAGQVFTGSGRVFEPPQGPGDCGVPHTPTQLVVGLNNEQFTHPSDSHACNQLLHITSGGRTVDAIVTDNCGNCPEGDLELSPGVYTALGIANPPPSRIPITWEAST